MTRESKRRTRKTKQDRWKKKLIDIILAILGGLAAMVIWNIGEYIFGWMLSFWKVVVGFVSGLLVACVVWLFLAKRYPDLQRKVLFFLSLAVTMLCLPIVPGAVHWRPVQVPELKKWNFEDGTTQGWGIYDKIGGRVVKSPDVVAESKEFADGTWCLCVDDINIESESQTGTAAFEKLVAVRYQGNLSLANAKLAASVYAPADAGFSYADVRFFLFIDLGPEEKNWCQSGTVDEGVLLEPGRWVELAWDLRPEETREWPSPWPWRNMLGIKIYVGGTFKGPVYIDNVTITVPE